MKRAPGGLRSARCRRSRLSLAYIAFCAPLKYELGGRYGCPVCMDMIVILQPAEPDDVAFAYEVTEAAMRVYVEQTWGAWDVALQLVNNAKSFDPSTHHLVLVDGKRAGIVATVCAESCVQLEKLYLLPAFQNLGVGSQVLLKLFQSSTFDGKAVRLRVLKVNEAAQRFYRRFGFVVTSTTPQRVFMEASPAQRHV